MSSPTLYRLGDTGPDVAALQRRITPHSGEYDYVFRAAVIQWQRAQGLAGDGIIGPLSIARLRSGGFQFPAEMLAPGEIAPAAEPVPPVCIECASVPSAPARIVLPRETHGDMTRVYGAPSASPSYLRWFSFPHPQVRLYSRTGALLRDHVGDSRLDHRTHRLLAERLENALAEIYLRLGRAGYEKEGWHVYSGSHNYRPTTGGGRLSTHAWSAAVDMNGAENPFASTRTTFSDEAIDIMEKWGWLSGGRAWGKDWMHFQAAVPSISPGSYYATNGLPRNIVAG